MGTYNVKPLEQYIEKHGEVKGTRLWNAEMKKKKTYESSPFQRLTIDWFIWRYGKEKGITKFNNHVSKSKQSLENFITRYGEDEGKQKYKETLSKKNTVDQIRHKYGDDADDILKNINHKRVETRSATLNAMSAEERKIFTDKTTNKSRETKKRNARGRSKFQIYCDVHGDAGPELYARYLQSIFKSIGHSREAENFIFDIINKNQFLNQYSLYYRSSLDKVKKEWFMSDKEGVSFYDFCVKETKTILEYDGSRWHPTKEQADLFGDDLMEIIGISYKEKYESDLKKIKRATDKGFDVFVVRSDMTLDEKENIINKFIEKVKQNG